jgi:hypothetical protein
VSLWTHEIEHPFATQLAEGRASYFARRPPSKSTEPVELSTWIYAAVDPTWGDPDSFAIADEQGRCQIALPRAESLWLPISTTTWLPRCGLATRGERSRHPPLLPSRGRLM